MKRIIRTLTFGGLIWLCAAPVWAAESLDYATTNAFKQSLKQANATFALTISPEVSLPLQWHESPNSFAAQGIHTYIGTLNGETVAYVSIDDKENVVGSLYYGSGYDISSNNGLLVLSPTRHTDSECGLNSTSAADSDNAGEKTSAPNALGARWNTQLSQITSGTRAGRNTLEAPVISDGTYRIFRLAVFMSYSEFHSPKFNTDVSKVKAFWAQLETYLNEIYVRDLGVQFQVIDDERLIERVNNGAYYYSAGTGLINAAIGTENYDIGLLLDYAENTSLGGLAHLGGIQYPSWKGHAVVYTQDLITMAHELGHMFGAEHPFTYSVGLWGTCNEPGSGQSVVSYGTSSKTAFISLQCIKEMKAPKANVDKTLPLKYPNTNNTAPRIDRDRMKTTYRVPQGTFFTIPVYADDAEQKELNYSFNQFGCSRSNQATFPVYPPQRGNVLEFGRKHNGSGSIVPNSDKVPVGNYQFWLSVSDALPLSDAIARHHAPLYDGYIANVEVVAATPFKITSTIDKKYSMGDKLHLTWDVDKTFFPRDSKVRVVMSDDFGKTYRHVLMPATANDGECDVFIPQQLMARVPTYSIVVPNTGEKIDIWFAGKGILRLETIDDDTQYYDLTSQALNGGGIEVVDSKVVFGGLPEASYIIVGKDETLPAKPDVTATIDGRAVELTYTETTEGNIITRTWQTTQGGKTSGVRQFIELRGSTSTDVRQVATQETVTVRAQGQVILVDGLRTKARVSVYGMDGRLVTTAVSGGGEVRLPLPTPGVYVVAVDGKTVQKVQVNE